MIRFKELGIRTAVAVIGIPLIIFGLFTDKIFFLAIVLIIQILAGIEFYRLVLKKGYFPNIPVGILTIIVISIGIFFNHGELLGYILFIILFILMFLEMFRCRQHPLVNIAVTLFGALYISFFSALILIREYPPRPDAQKTGPWLVMQIFLTIWICDTAAYLWGSRFGKHKLFPRISPKKSWEGAIAGLIIGILGALIIRHFFIQQTSLLYAVIVGVIAGVFGQIGDLIESFFKRDVGVKDSSALLPGHGGFLDRFDSPLIVAPIVLFILRRFGLTP